MIKLIRHLRKFHLYYNDIAAGHTPERQEHFPSRLQARTTYVPGKASTGQIGYDQFDLSVSVPAKDTL
jgi:hypothetical protein